MDEELHCKQSSKQKLPMKVTIKSGWPEQPAPEPAEKPSFAELEPRGPARAFSFLSSLCLHVAMVWAAVSTVQVVESQMALLHDQEYPIIALQLSVISDTRPQRLTDPVKPPVAAGRASRGSAARPATPVPTPDVNSASETKVAAHVVAHNGRRFQLPVVTRKPARQVLIRVDIPQDLALDPKIAVPEVMLWQQALTAKPKGTLITAAHEENPVHVRETPTVKPQLTVQNREKELADLRQAERPPVPAPALPVPVANTTPIRLLDGVLGNRLPNSTGPVIPVPEEVHVISVPDRPVPQARIIVLPPANQGTPPPSSSSSDTGGAGQATSNDARQPRTSDQNQRPGAVTGGNAAANSSQASNQPGRGGAAGASGATRASGAAGAGDVAGESNSLSATARVGDGVAASGPASGGRDSSIDSGLGPTPPNTTRILRPKDGKYTVTILGSSNLDAYPEAAGILSGKLVYTVYVRAGGRKEWILQYCLPAAAEQAVRLRGSAVPIAAPYPFVIYHPNLPFPNDPEYVIIHGFITVAGRFERLSAIGDLDSSSKASLIGALEHWEFRPAMRDGEPSAVEVALIIPREPL